MTYPTKQLPQTSLKAHTQLDYAVARATRRVAQIGALGCMVKVDGEWLGYSPSRSAEQCLALVERYKVTVRPDGEGQWQAYIRNAMGRVGEGATPQVAVARLIANTPGL